MRSAMRFAVLLLATTATALAEDSLRDPTRPTQAAPAVAATTVSSLQVSAVFISGERRLAIVNGQRVREGDAIGGATVTKIRPNEVRFVRNGKALAVSILRGTTRK